MRLRTLGELQLEGIDFGRPKPLVLLAFLALEGPQERGHLAELFFQRGSRGRNNLSTTLSRLRRAAPGVVEADTARVWTDVTTDAGQLLSALEQREPQRATELYLGRFLSGIDVAHLPDELEEWVLETREFIAGRVVDAQLALAEGAAVRGRFDIAARHAEDAYRLGDATPEPEIIRRLHTLMLAGGSLYAEGAAKEAIEIGLGGRLAASREEARERLRSLLGIESAIPHNLPSRDTLFIGRTAELVGVHRLLAAHRLVTIVGMGGIGKTRLALQVALEHLQQGAAGDGVYFVPLEAVSSASLLPRTVASVLGLVVETAEDPLAQIVQQLQGKRVLLVLDNFEHLLDAAPGLAVLLGSCPELRLLVTSRERLHLSEEQLYTIEGLSYPAAGDRPSQDETIRFDAVQLFVERARRSDPDLELAGESVAAVVALCRLVEGNPLALELISVWVRALPVTDLVRELEQNLDLLSARTRDLSDRHRSIRACFEHSWELLGSEERRTLRQLAVFRGGFVRQAAAEVAGATIPLLASLIDKSLLRASPTGRYDRHPLLYRFMLEKMAEEPEELRASRDRHAHHFLALAEAAPNLNSADQLAWLERFEVEHDNLRMAVEWLIAREDAEGALRLAIASSAFWSRSGFWEKGVAYFEQALTLPGDHAALRAKAMSRAGTLLFQQRAFAEARRWYEQSLAIARELGNDRDVSAALDVLGELASIDGRYLEARELLEEGLAIRRALGLEGATAWTLLHLSAVDRAEGRHDEAVAHLHESRMLFRSAKHDQGLGWALQNSGEIARDRGEFDAAQRHFEEALALRRRLKEWSAVSASLVQLGALELQRGDEAKARIHLLEGFEMSWRHGFEKTAVRARELLDGLAGHTS